MDNLEFKPGMTRGMEFEPGNPQEDGPKRIAKRDWHKILVRLGIAAAVVAGIGLLVLFTRSTTFDGIYRSFVYSRADKDENGCAQLYAYSAEKDRSYATLEGSLILASQQRIMMLGDDGNDLYNVDVNFHKSAVVTGGQRAAVYDLGGREIHLLDGHGLVRTLRAEGDILACSINEKGYLAVTTGKSGYKAAVSVYDGTGEMKFQFNSSDRFLMTSVVSRQGNQMASVAMGEKEGAFSSSVVLYDMGRSDPLAGRELSGGAVFDMGLVGRNYCAVAEDALHMIDRQGSEAGIFEYEGSFLRRCSLNGDGFAALVLGRYRSGPQARLVSVDEQGAVLGQLRINSEVLSISAAGKYIAVLYSDHMTIYDKRLSECAELEDVSAAKAVLMRADGSAVLVGAESASLYLP